MPRQRLTLQTHALKQNVHSIIDNLVVGMIKRLKTAANVKGNVSPKRFRAGFARSFVETGGEISVLAKLLGHTDVNVTAQHYAVFSPDELEALHNERGVLSHIFDKARGED